MAEQRTAEAAGAAPVYVNYVPKLGDTTAPRDLQEAADYYLTPRGQHPNSTNQMLLTSISTLVVLHGLRRSRYPPDPARLLVVAGSEAGSLWHSQELHAKAASTDKELVHHRRCHAHGPLRWRGRGYGDDEGRPVLHQQTDLIGNRRGSVLPDVRPAAPAWGRSNRVALGAQQTHLKDTDMICGSRALAILTLCFAGLFTAPAMAQTNRATFPAEFRPDGDVW